MFLGPEIRAIRSAIVGGAISLFYGFVVAAVLESQLPEDRMGLGGIFIATATIWCGYVGGKFAFELSDPSDSARAPHLSLGTSLRKGTLFGVRFMLVLSAVVGLALVIADISSLTLSVLFSRHSLFFCLSLGAFLSVIGAISGGALFVLIDMICLVSRPADSNGGRLKGRRLPAMIFSSVGSFFFSWRYLSYVLHEPVYFRIPLQAIHRWSLAIIVGAVAWWFFYRLFLKVRLIGARAIIYGPVVGVMLVFFAGAATGLIDSWFIHSTRESTDGLQNAIVFIRRCMTGAFTGTLYAIIAVLFHSSIFAKALSTRQKDTEVRASH